MTNNSRNKQLQSKYNHNEHQATTTICQRTTLSLSSQEHERLLNLHLDWITQSLKNVQEDEDNNRFAYVPIDDVS